MSNKPILYILLEVKARELEGRTLLALEAATRGFLTIVGNKEHINYGLKSNILRPGVYFDKSLTRGKEEKLESVAAKGCMVASQDEEGGLLDQSIDRFISFRSTPETVAITNAIFCWGNHDCAGWSKHHQDSSSRIFITGSPRIDFWRSDFDSYFRLDMNNIKKRFDPFVLLPSRFVGANNYRSIEERIEQGRNNGSIRTMQDELLLRSKAADSRKMFILFTEMINSMAEKYKDLNFVVRPHPAEKVSGWQKRLEKKDNLHLVFEKGISPWVRSAEAILHNGCTTGIEAYVCGVPAIAYTPFESPINRKIPNRLSIKCTTEEEVSRVLSRIITGEKVDEHRTPENDETIRHRLANVKGDTAAKRIVDVLEKLDVPESPPVRPGLAGLKVTLKTEYSRFINRFRNKETRITRKFPGLKLSELKEIQDNLAMVTDKYRGCRIRRLFGDVFVVEKD
jgi:surface carbohydrate biosynthesis protein